MEFSVLRTRNYYPSYKPYKWKKTLATTEQNLATLSVTEDAVNSRQYPRNESRSHNSNRPDSNRRTIDVGPHSKPNHRTADMHFRVKPTVHVTKPIIYPPQSSVTVGTGDLM